MTRLRKTWIVAAALTVGWFGPAGNGMAAPLTGIVTQPLAVQGGIVEQARFVRRGRAKRARGSRHWRSSHRWHGSRAWYRDPRMHSSHYSYSGYRSRSVLFNSQ